MRSQLSLAALMIIFGSIAPAGALRYPTIVGGAIIQSSEPYLWSGRCTFEGGGTRYQGTGTVINASSVLTCAHLIYNESYGESINMKFALAEVGGVVQTTHRSKHKARAMYFIEGYTTHDPLSDKGFARDLGGIKIRGTPNTPNFAPWTTDFSLLNSNHFRMSVGYGGGLHGPYTAGRTMLKSSPVGPSYEQRAGGFYANFSYVIEPGMSGGPTWVYVNRQWLIAAINVAGFSVSGRPVGSGYRVLDARAARFINRYLAP